MEFDAATNESMRASMRRADNRNCSRHLALTSEQHLPYYENWRRVASRSGNSFSTVGEVVVANVWSRDGVNFWPCNPLGHAGYFPSMVPPYPPSLHGSHIPAAAAAGAAARGGGSGSGFNVESDRPPYQITVSQESGVRNHGGTLPPEVTPPGGVHRGRGIYASGFTSSSPVHDADEARKMWFQRQTNGSGNVVGAESSALLTPIRGNSSVDSTSPYASVAAVTQLPMSPFSSPSQFMHSATSATGCSSGATSSSSLTTPANNPSDLDKWSCIDNHDNHVRHLKSNGVDEAISVDTGKRASVQPPQCVQQPQLGHPYHRCFQEGHHIQSCAQMPGDESISGLKSYDELIDALNKIGYSSTDDVIADLDQLAQQFRVVVGKSRPPEDYLCHVCFEKGHYIKHCPLATPRGEGLTPYQGKKRCFGEFKCPKCKRKWKSGNSWANIGQDCVKCKVNVFPCKQRPLNCGVGNFSLVSPILTPAVTPASLHQCNKCRLVL